jgi:hypothetical protein
MRLVDLIGQCARGGDDEGERHCDPHSDFSFFADPNLKANGP